MPSIPISAFRLPSKVEFSFDRVYTARGTCEDCIFNFNGRCTANTLHLGDYSCLKESNKDLIYLPFFDFIGEDECPI